MFIALVINFDLQVAVAQKVNLLVQSLFVALLSCTCFIAVAVA